MYNISRLSYQAVRLGFGAANDFGQLGMSTEPNTFYRNPMKSPCVHQRPSTSHMSPRWSFRGDLIMFAIYIPARWGFGL